VTLHQFRVFILVTHLFLVLYKRHGNSTSEFDKTSPSSCVNRKTNEAHDEAYLTSHRGS